MPIVRDFAPVPSDRDSDPRTHARERREAVLRALEIIGSVSRGLRVPGSGGVGMGNGHGHGHRHGGAGRRVRVV